jgi:DNA-binding NarL/FixJ family response regulator
VKRRNASRSRATDLARARRHHAERAWQEAYEAFARADAAAPLDPDDLDSFVDATMLAGHVEQALAGLERSYEARLAPGQERAAARIAFWLGMRLMSLGERARASGWLARAQTLIGDEDCAERGYLLLPIVRRHEQAGDLAAARAAAAEAQALGDRFRDADLSAFARAIRGAWLIRHGEVQAGLALIDEAMLAATSGKLSTTVTGLTYCTALAGCQQVFALDRGREWTQALAAWCQGQPQLVGFVGQCRVHRAELLVLGGDWSEAMGEARKLGEVDRRFDPSAAAEAAYQAAEVHRMRGEIDEAERAYRTASEQGRDPQPGLSLLWLRAGRGDAAAAALRRVLGATSAPLRRAQFLPATVEVMLAVGALDEAADAARELEDIAARFQTDVLSAMAAHARGAVELAGGRAPAALEALRRAFAAWQQLGAPYLAARVRLLIARACRAVGDEASAKLERELADQVLERLGAAGLADEAPGPPPTQDGVVAGAAAAGTARGLTARELQVLRLVATGKTNKAIARELFLSEKTIDRHVSNIFDKLDVATRAAATAFAYERRLI